MDKAAARVSAQLGKAGFDEAMLAALAAEDVLAADETPVNVLDKTAAPAAAQEKDEADPEEKQEKAAAGAPHVLITRTPDGRLTFLQAMASRRKAALAAGLPTSFTGYLITDGYTGYQHLLSSRLAGHPAVRCPRHHAGAGQSRNSAPAACRTGPGTSSRSCAALIRPSRPPAPAGTPPWTSRSLDNLRERYDTAVASGIIHNRLRDWHDREPPRLRPRQLAARIQGTGLPVHPKLRRELDK